MKQLYILLLAITIPTLVSAVPAYKGSITFQQSDHTQFSGKLKGDEWFNWIEDKKGNVITFNNATKNYEYGIIKKIDGALELVPSGIKATDSNTAKVNSPASKLEKIERDTLMQIWKEKREKASSHK